MDNSWRLFQAFDDELIQRVRIELGTESGLPACSTGLMRKIQMDTKAFFFIEFVKKLDIKGDVQVIINHPWLELHPY